MNSRKSKPTAIEIRGAKVHNLKNIDISIPLNKFVAISGVSGSGKSSLALGVLYSEGSRRYLEAFSTYTRRRITQASRPDIESIENIPASIALHQRPAIPNIRSTFGTSTELLNSLRLMFSRLGCYCCSKGHRLEPSMNIALDKPLVCPVCGESFMGLGAESFAFNSDGACARCGGTGEIRDIDENTFVPDENLTLEQGAVMPWRKFGISWMYKVAVELGVRADVPFCELTAEEKEIVFHGQEVKRKILIPSSNGKLFELNCTYRNARRAVEEALKGAITEKSLERINKYFSIQKCPDCEGTRLNKRVLSVLLCGKNLAEITAMTLDDLIPFIKNIPDNLPNDMKSMAKMIVEQFLDNSKRLIDLGLGYLTLDRASATLSTGERQRVQLARTLRNSTTGVLYVLDEPTIGLHPSNIDGLLGIVNDLVDGGNSIVLVDHDIQILKEADYLIEMGKGAGVDGGRVVASGSIEEIKGNKDSQIGGFIAKKEKIVVRDRVSEKDMFKSGKIHISTNKIHTVQPLDVDIPQNRLVAVSGVSGSGKTTLILESLVPALQAKISKNPLPKYVKSIETDGIKRVNLIDATPIGNNVRSTMATYSGILDDLREIYASQDLSKIKNYSNSDFSYNTGKLRCAGCDGTGQIVMDVQFLPDVEITCPDCHGSRYSKEAEEIKLKISESKEISLPKLLGMTIDQLLSEMESIKNNTNIKNIDKIINKLRILSNLGLGYLTLNEATPALSGGEAQRLKLSLEMGKNQKNTLFVFDEPTIGLHPLNIRDLIIIFQKLIDNGASVLVIEHDLDVIKNCDYVIDMGPGGGVAGGRVIVSGTPETIAKCEESITGRYLGD